MSQNIMTALTEECHADLAVALRAFIANPLDYPLSRSQIMEVARLALPVLDRQEKGEPAWIHWSGEVALPPVANDVLVEVRMLGGNHMTGPAKTMRWRNFAPRFGDIIAYRVLETIPS